MYEVKNVSFGFKTAAYRRLKVTLPAIIAISMAVAACVNATIIYSQDPVNHAFSRTSDWSNENQKADDFTLTGGPKTVTKISWWGSYGASPDPAVDSFVFKFFTEDPIVPGFPDIWCFSNGTRYPKSYAAPDFTRVATSMVSDASTVHDGGVVYAYSAVLDYPIKLDGGKRYWLAITNSTPNYVYPPQQNSKWGWLESGAGSQWYRAGHCAQCADDWGLSSTKNLAFAIETVPTLAISGKSVSHPIWSLVSKKYLFSMWGRAGSSGAGDFVLDDGSGTTVKVELPSTNVIGDGDFVKATGLLTSSERGKVLRADPADVVKVQ
jgi:hypothetical protein